MSQCELGQHRLEYQDCREGITYYLCIDCSETIMEYQDCVAGG